MHIGDKIYKLRRLNNETMNDLVKQTGVSQSWLSDIESGKKQRADFNKICAIAKHYEVSLEYFSDDCLDSDEHKDIFPLTGEAGVRSMKLIEQSLKYLNGKEEPNLLEIKLKDTDSVPEVWYRGERVDELPNGLVDVYMHWHTCEADKPTKLMAILEYVEGTDIDPKRVEVYIDEEGERGSFNLLKDEIDD